MKFSVLHSIDGEDSMDNTPFFDILMDDVIRDIISLMKLGNEYRIASFSFFSKHYAFIAI